MEERFFRFVVEDFLSIKLDIENRIVFSSAQGEMCMYVSSMVEL